MSKEEFRKYLFYKGDVADFVYISPPESSMVHISLNEYDELRDFKRNIEAGNVQKVSYSTFGVEVKYITIKEALKETAEINKAIIEEKYMLKHELYDVRKMSVFQFLKWRKQK